MPKVHEDQKTKFEEESFNKFHTDTELKYTLPGELASSERIGQLHKDMRDGVCSVAFKGCGTNLPLRFKIPEGETVPAKAWADFDKEGGKVHLRSRMILNGVCCSLIVVLDLETFDGVGRLEYDEDLAKVEAQKAQDNLVDILPHRQPAFQPPSQSATTPTMWDGQSAISDVKPINLPF